MVLCINVVIFAKEHIDTPQYWQNSSWTLNWDWSIIKKHYICHQTDTESHHENLEGVVEDSGLRCFIGAWQAWADWGED